MDIGWSRGAGVVIAGGGGDISGFRWCCGVGVAVGGIRGVCVLGVVLGGVVVWCCCWWWYSIR